MHMQLNKNPSKNLQILLQFSTSKDKQYQYTAFWALKDYILLTTNNNMFDIGQIIQAFLNGCLSDESKIQAECANAISFLVTHSLVYKSLITEGMSDAQIKEATRKVEKQPVEYILDAIMYLSGNDSKFIRTTAFSTLSSLSKYSSNCPSVMAQITRDIEIPDNMTSKEYLTFIRERLQQQKDLFYDKIKDEIKFKFTGLYSLLRLAQEPTEVEIEDACNMFIDFIKKPYDPLDSNIVENEEYFIKVFASLKHSKNPKILRKLLKVIQFYIDQDDSKCQKEIINPHTILWMLEIMEHQR